MTTVFPFEKKVKDNESYDLGFKDGYEAGLEVARKESKDAIEYFKIELEKQKKKP